MRDVIPFRKRNPERLLRKKSLAEALDVSVSWIEQRMPHIPHEKLGPHPQSPLRFELSKVRRWIADGQSGYEGKSHGRRN